MKMETIFIYLALVATAYSKRNDILFLWFNGHKDGETCPFYFTVVNITGVTLTTCAKRCELNSDCVSFWHREYDGTCTGCKEIFGVNSHGFPLLQESKYFYETTGWWYFSNSRFILIRARGPFRNEEEICVNLGGHIVKVESAVENEFLVSLMNNHTGTMTLRIGLSDIQTDGQFRWVADGSTVTYQNWESPDQPIHNVNDDDCAYMGTDGLWKTGSCSSQVIFVCEVK